MRARKPTELPTVYDVTIIVHPTGEPHRKKTHQLPSVHRENIRKAFEQNPTSLLHGAVERAVLAVEAEIG